MSSTSTSDSLEKIEDCKLCGGFNMLLQAWDAEFLVAQEREGRTYNFVSSDSDSDGDSKYSTTVRWACPASAAEPTKTVLEECRKVLVQNTEPVSVGLQPHSTIEQSKTYNDGYIRDPPCPAAFRYWHLEPAKWATPKEGTPSEFDWVGVRLRSPMLCQCELKRDWSPFKLVLGALRWKLRMHVNSSCFFTVHISPRVPKPTGLFLMTIQRLVTLVMMLEQDMILPCSPGQPDERSGQCIPITHHSRNARLPLRGYLHARPDDTALKVTMDKHLPLLEDEEMQERLADIWSRGRVCDITATLRNKDFKDIALAIPMWTNEERDAQPAVQFRYGIWHPYDGLDASTFWAALAIKLYASASQLYYDKFSRLVEAIDDLIAGFEEHEVPSESRRKILLDKIGLHEDWCAPWEKIMEEYRPGGRLAPGSIDSHPWLGQIEELKVYRTA